MLIFSQFPIASFHYLHHPPLACLRHKWHAYLSWARGFLAVICCTNTHIQTMNCLWRERSANVSLNAACLPAMERQVWSSRPSCCGEARRKRPQCVRCLIYMQLRDARCGVISSLLPSTGLKGNSRQATGYKPAALISPSFGLSVCGIHIFLSWFWLAPSQQLMSYQDPK